MSFMSSAGSCPLCGEANHCAMVSAVNAEPPCWCTQASFTEELLASFPRGARGKVCICQRCATGAASKPPASSNPSIERTSSSKLRLLPAAAHVERRPQRTH
jgi:hypothetical protein